MLAVVSCGKGKTTADQTVKQLTFDEMRVAADSVAKAAYGKCVTLYEVEGVLTRDSDGTLTEMIVPEVSRVVYCYQENDTTMLGTVIVSFDKTCAPTVTKIDEPWLEDVKIEGSVKMLTFKDALDKLYQADIVKPTSNFCTLRQALLPTVTEPQYIFGNAKGWVTVGAVSGKVQWEK